MLKSFRSYEEGFSLVELAISITVLGILLGMVVKGRDVLDGARVTATLAQVKNYSAAATNYKDAYGAYPGDDSALPAGCSGICVAGDGDGYIESANGSDPDWDAAYGANDEAVQFWRFLVVEEMVTGVTTSADVSAVTNYAAGVTHPVGALAGQFDVFYDSDLEPNDFTSVNQKGHFLRLSVNGAAAIKPILAKAMDRKIDDGMPYSGRVLAGGATCVLKAGNANALTDAYDVGSESRECSMFFKFGGRRK